MGFFFLPRNTIRGFRKASERKEKNYCGYHNEEELRNENKKKTKKEDKGDRWKGEGERSGGRRGKRKMIKVRKD